MSKTISVTINGTLITQQPQVVFVAGNPANAQITSGSGATVEARVVREARGEKKIVFKYTRKTRYKKKKGHRQPFTKVEILKISA